ncbi:site-specific integrase [Chloroflexota bacterium]
MAPCWAPYRGENIYTLAYGDRDWIKIYFSYKNKDKRYSKETLDTHKRYISHLRKYTIKTLTPRVWGTYWNMCDGEVMKGYFARLYEKGNNSKTLMRKMTVIKDYFDFMVSKGQITENPLKGVSKC